MKGKIEGFTLIELMVVIVIIGILAALAIPKFTDASAKAKMSEAPTTLAGYESAQLAYVAEKGSCGAATDLIFILPTSKWFSYSMSAGGNSATCGGTSTTTIGSFNNGGWLLTTVNNSSVVSHSSSGSDAAAVKKYLPNF